MFLRLNEGASAATYSCRPASNLSPPNTARSHLCTEHVLDLHKLLVWVPAIQVAHALLSALHFLFCPWGSTVEKIVGAGWVVVAILKEPVMLVCLLMVAKGWCITRANLTFREVVHSSMIVTLLYACVIIQLSGRGFAAVVPALIMFVAMLVNVVSSIITNLRVLKAQLLALRSFNIDATTTPAYTKYKMFAVLLVAAVLYFFADIALFVMAAVAPRPPWLATLLRQILETVTAAIVGYVFRARPFNVMFEQVQQLAADVADSLLPQITTVVVDLHALRGDGTVPWSRSMELKETASGREAVAGASSAADLSLTSRTRPLSSSATSGLSFGSALTVPAASPPDLLVVLNPADSVDLTTMASDDSAAAVSVSRSLVVASKVAGSECGGRHVGLGSVSHATRTEPRWHFWRSGVNAVMGGGVSGSSRDTSSIPAANDGGQSRSQHALYQTQRTDATGAAHWSCGHGQATFAVDHRSGSLHGHQRTGSGPPSCPGSSRVRPEPTTHLALQVATNGNLGASSRSNVPSMLPPATPRHSQLASGCTPAESSGNASVSSSPPASMPPSPPSTARQAQGELASLPATCEVVVVDLE